MKVVIIGSGASMPDSERSSPSQVIVVDEERLLFDCGPGTGMNLMKAGFNPKTVNNIFLTHLHIDHSAELPSIIFSGYLAGREKKMHLYGPSGTIGFCNSFFQLIYPSAPEIIRKMRKDGWNVSPHEATKGLVWEFGTCRVISAPVEHGVPAVAYRIETREEAVVVSGDTRPCKSLVELSKGADLLIQECSYPDDMIGLARLASHCTASEAGEIARQVDVKKVILTHLFPLWKGREKEMVKSVSSKFAGEVIPSHDLLEVEV